MSCNSSRSFLTGTLVDIQQINAEIFSMELSWSGPAPQPGQFFMLRPERSSIFLGRPISVWRWKQGSANSGTAGVRENRGSLFFLTALRGRGTREMAAMQAGDRIELSGPLGNCWPLTGSGNTAIKETGGKTGRIPAALVGGGIGIAPLAFLAERLTEKSFDLYAGFRSKPYGIEHIRSRTSIIATEDGCEGTQGRIPDLLEAVKYDNVYACGPDPMLRAVAAACAASGTSCYLSLERRMACGVGACLGCTVETKHGNRRCCVDGPVFDAAELLYD